MTKIAIKVSGNSKTLSSFGGLFLFESWMEKFSLREKIGKFLPKKLRNRGMGSWDKFKTGILGFISGGECLDDLDVLSNDPLFNELDGGIGSVTMGRYLRSFERRSIENMKDGLASTACLAEKTLERTKLSQNCFYDGCDLAPTVWNTNGRGRLQLQKDSSVGVPKSI